MQKRTSFSVYYKKAMKQKFQRINDALSRREKMLKRFVKKVNNSIIKKK